MGLTWFTYVWSSKSLYIFALRWKVRGRVRFAGSNLFSSRAFFSHARFAYDSLRSFFFNRKICLFLCFTVPYYYDATSLALLANSLLLLGSNNDAVVVIVIIVITIYHCCCDPLKQQCWPRRKNNIIIIIITIGIQPHQTTIRPLLPMANLSPPTNVPPIPLPPNLHPSSLHHARWDILLSQEH